MGQGDVFKLLEKEKRWMNTEEIAKILGVGRGNVSKCLRIMVENGEILEKDGRLGAGHRVGLFKIKE